MRIVAMIALIVVTWVLAPAASAVITFNQLDDDIFVISHRVKIIGSRGKAQKMVYRKAASLCMAAEYSYFKILDQESEASQRYEIANATVQVQFFHEDAEGRISCDKNADEKYVGQAKAKLTKIGYEPPSEPTAPPDEGNNAPSSCSVEQITAMVKAGFSDEQIKAACPD